MTTSSTALPEENVAPDWDLADRLYKSLRLRNIGVNEMAVSFGKSRNTIGRWLNGRITPSKSEVYFWAVLTGVNHQWLETGIPSDDAVRACRDSNPKPSVWEPRIIQGGKRVKHGLTVFGPVVAYGPTHRRDMGRTLGERLRAVQ